MSLTSHLKDSQSPIRRFLSEQFPHTKPVLAAIRATPAGSTTIRPTAPVPWAVIGTALDYRLRYYFAVTPIEDLAAWEGVSLAMHPTRRFQIILPSADIAADWEAILLDRKTGDTITPGDISDWRLPPDQILAFAESLDDVIERLQPVGRRLDRPDEAEINRYCVVLALFEQLYRDGEPAVRHSPLFVPQAKTTLPSLLAIAQEHWIDDLCALSWAFHEKFGELLTLPAILNPTFDGSADVGGADADLIVDSCLIDVKATVSPKLTTDWLYQLLGYVLLDYSGRYGIREVAMYLARQQAMLRWPLDRLMEILAGGKPPSLPELRAQFQRVARQTSRV